VAAAVVVAAGGAWWLRPSSELDGLPVDPVAPSDPVAPFDPAAAEVGCRTKVAQGSGWEQIGNPKIRVVGDRAALYVYMLDNQVRECLIVGPHVIHRNFLNDSEFLRQPGAMQFEPMYDPVSGLTLTYGWAPPEVEEIRVTAEPGQPVPQVFRDGEVYLAYVEGDHRHREITTVMVTPTHTYTSVNGLPRETRPR
jgi:hypothetical protein